RASRTRRRSRYLIEARKGQSTLEVQCAEPGVGWEDERVERTALERVLLGLDPDVPERVGRVVGIAQRHRSVHALRGGVDGRLELVIGALLPVAGTGSARSGAVHVAWADGQRREERRV